MFNLGKKNLNKVVDGAIKGIDALILTKEEKADKMAQIAQAQADFAIKAMSANSTSSKARRIIAIMIIASFLILMFTSVIAYKFDPVYANFVFGILKSDISILTLMVMGFYFGGYMASTHLMGRKKDKK